MGNGDVHGEVGAIRAGFLWALVATESSSSRFLFEPSDRSSGPLVRVNGDSLGMLADLLRFRTGDGFSSRRFLVLKSSTEPLSLLGVARSGDLSGGVAGFAGNNKGGEEDDEMRGEDAVGTMVANRGGTGWNTEVTVSSLVDSNDSPDEHRFRTGGGGVLGDC